MAENRESERDWRLGDWLVPNADNATHVSQHVTTYRATYKSHVTHLRHVQHLGNEIKKICLHFIE